MSDVSDWATVLKRMRLSASILVFDECAREDVVQEAIMGWIIYEKKHGRRSSQTYDQAILDACRRVFGNARRKCHAERSAINRPFHGEAAELESLFAKLPAQSGDDGRVPAEDGRVFSVYAMKMTAREVVAVDLLSDGFNFQEVAEQMGVAPSTISHLTGRAKKYLEGLSLMRKKDKILGTKTLEVDWITL